MKRIIPLIIAFAVIISLFTACGSDKSKDDRYHPLYIKDDLKSKNAVATFFNSYNGKSKNVKMKKISESKKSYTFFCEGDTERYNMAYITFGKEKSIEFAFNKCTSGWHKTKDNLLPYAYGKKDDYYPKYDEITLKGHGYDKNIYIWKPDYYDPESADKYSTVYLLDAQIVSPINSDGRDLGGCPLFVEQVRDMTAATGRKTIVVLIDNVFARDFELVPEIGESLDEKYYKKAHNTDEVADYDAMNGSEFADFTANTLVPYIQKHYNVYTEPKHNSIAGVSLSGLEAFYITMEYPKVFGAVGGISPSLWEYDDATWNKYLSSKKFGKSSPIIYLYTGPKKHDTEPHVSQMYNRLKKLGYPKDRLILHLNPKGEHSGYHWRSIFSEFLCKWSAVDR
ncbi:MAG: alpha/beta hydrolase-fold protein [Ruminococcus sp.]|nr:alpha/beta hydrolase-fold protein [Ruminococcus sp.]